MQKKLCRREYEEIEYTGSMAERQLEELASPATQDNKGVHVVFKIFIEYHHRLQVK